MFKFTLSLIFLLFLSFKSVANPYDYRVIRVIDGDTVEIDAPFLPIELHKTLKIRLYGLDTPEKGSRAKCKSEAIIGENATKFTTMIVGAAKKHQVIFMKWDKFGGRVNGDILLDGNSLAKLLIDKGYAKPYFGVGKKFDWCKK